MQFGYLVSLCGFFLLSGVTQAEEGDLSSNDPGLAQVLQRSSEAHGSPYFLQVDCTDQRGIRSFELFPGGATIWNRRSQIMLPASTRSDLLKILADRDFAGFDSSYGGREQPAKSAAPARVTCRIRIEIQNLEKSSMQLAGGEQSLQLLDLAAVLLDKVQVDAASAVTPVDMQDALDKLSDGQLAPQVLRLRFVDLSARDSNNRGSILRLSGGRISHQEYYPGQLLAEPAMEPLGHEQYTRLITTMQTAQLASLPANLWSEDQLELEVQVLAHKKIVLARRFTRLESAKQEPAQQHFAELLFELRELALAISK